MEFEEAINTDLDLGQTNVVRTNHEKYKAMVLEKTTDNPGVESDNTVIAIENKINWICFCG